MLPMVAFAVIIAVPAVGLATVIMPTTVTFSIMTPASAVATDPAAPTPATTAVLSPAPLTLAPLLPQLSM
jgi:hypothetical protein